MEDTKGYPENRLVFGSKLPASAFYIKHVKALIFNNVSITYVEQDYRPSLYFEDVKGIRLKGILLDNKQLNPKQPSMLKQNKSEIMAVVD